jgi:hypothetical protein
MNTMICWGGSQDGQIVEYIGQTYTPPSSFGLHPTKQEKYKAFRDRFGKWHYGERWFLRMYYVWLAKQVGFVPMMDEAWSEFRNRVPISWHHPKVHFPII